MTSIKYSQIEPVYAQHNPIILILKYLKRPPSTMVSVGTKPWFHLFHNCFTWRDEFRAWHSLPRMSSIAPDGPPDPIRFERIHPGRGRSVQHPHVESFVKHPLRNRAVRDKAKHLWDQKLYHTMVGFKIVGIRWVIQWCNVPSAQNRSHSCNMFAAIEARPFPPISWVSWW